MALGEARQAAGQVVQATEAYRDALAIAESQADEAASDDARLAMAQSLLAQGRYTEVIAIARQVLAARRPVSAVLAEFVWGTALSLEGADTNGAAAHLNKPGDLVILATFAEMTPEEARAHRPTVVRVDADNRIVDVHEERPGPVLRSIPRRTGST